MRVAIGRSHLDTKRRTAEQMGVRMRRVEIGYAGPLGLGVVETWRLLRSELRELEEVASN